MTADLVQLFLVFLSSCTFFVFYEYESAFNDIHVLSNAYRLGESTFMLIDIIQLLPLKEGDVTICSPEAGRSRSENSGFTTHEI